MPHRVGLVTSSQFPALADDDRPLVSYLQKIGIEAVPLVWSEPGIRWEDFDRCVLRSTWDYHRKFAEFNAWLDRVEPLTELWNPPPILRWNVRKTYLRDLEERGVAIVPTIWLGQPSEILAAHARRGGKRSVVKPVVSANAENTYVLDAGAPADALPSAAVSGDGLLLQPYLEEVESSGERSLVFLDGFFSHAVRRKAALNPAATLVDGDPVEPTPGEHASARAAIQAIGAPVMYARVDLVTTRDGIPRVMELELVEPSLYLGSHPPAAARLAGLIARGLSR
jgi:hypothetical protein